MKKSAQSPPIINELGRNSSEQRRAKNLSCHLNPRSPLQIHRTYTKRSLPQISVYGILISCEMWSLIEKTIPKICHSTFFLIIFTFMKPLVIIPFFLPFIYLFFHARSRAAVLTDIYWAFAETGPVSCTFPVLPLRSQRNTVSEVKLELSLFGQERVYITQPRTQLVSGGTCGQVRSA